MVCAVWQDNNTKPLIDAIAKSFQEDTHAEAKASIQASLASVRVTHLDIRTLGSTRQPHFKVYATNSEINKNEIWLYLRDCLLQ